MKSNATFKSLLVSGLLLLAGVSGVSAQDYFAADQSVTQSPVTYRLTFPGTWGGNDTRNGISLGTSSQNVSVVEVGRGPVFTYDVSIPAGTPLGTIITINDLSTPLWHVTVADILGNSQSDDNVVLRPLVKGDDEEGTGAESNPNAVSQPATTGVGVAASGVEKIQSKMEVYPNPATDVVNIVTEGEVLWGVTEIIDPTGKKVLELPTGANGVNDGVSRVTVNVSNLRAGMYFIRVRAGNEFMTKRIFVSH